MAKGAVIGGLNSGGSNIKSIQSGALSLFNDTTTTFDITISPIDPSKSIVDINYSFAFTPNVSSLGVELINSTTIRVYRKTGQAYPQITINWVVIEYNNVKSKQTGTYNILTAGSEQNVTVSSVDVNKSLLITSKTDGNTANNNGYYWHFRRRIINSTTLGFRVEVGTLSTVYWQVIEFN